ncbi:MAG: protein-glutamate O-methyltransferase CheR [Prolixibacteraceae bacterium]|nr:protein-glutamate O-methyltransferase CheR [Prolixibacteraceae bacterium]
METEFGKYIHLLKEKYALDVSMYDHMFLEKSIQFRMSSTACLDFEAYLNYMAIVPDEASRLVNQLSNSYSEFFRNPLTFSILEHVVLPKIFNEKLKHNGSEIRIWSAGCASGQEPYSLAMMLDNFRHSNFNTVSYRIFATDNSIKELEVARKGLFDFKAVKNTKLEYAQKYFNCSGETYVIEDKLKEQVDFSEYDLLDKDSSSPPVSIFGDFDLIMCSNVLFYYEPEYQQFILQKIYRALKPGGFFITGEAEKQIVNLFNGFRPFLVPASIFVKN